MLILNGTKETFWDQVLRRKELQIIKYNQIKRPQEYVNKIISYSFCISIMAWPMKIAACCLAQLPAPKFRSSRRILPWKDLQGSGKRGEAPRHRSVNTSGPTSMSKRSAPKHRQLQGTALCYTAECLAVVQSTGYHWVTSSMQSKR